MKIKNLVEKLSSLFFFKQEHQGSFHSLEALSGLRTAKKFQLEINKHSPFLEMKFRLKNLVLKYDFFILSFMTVNFK